MQASIAWRRIFTHKKLMNLYYKSVEKNASTGIDRITPTIFKEQLAENVEVICRKANNNTYKFTRYKQILISKGRKQFPREINVPTVRDKLTLAAIDYILRSVYGDDCITESPQIIIDEINREKSKYDSYIRIDIKAFYSSVNHELLTKLLKSKIRKKELLRLIKCAIETDSISLPSDKTNRERIRSRGLPEGLSISNTLANIFLSSLDRKYNGSGEYKYWRYVDDILILANEKEVSRIRDQIKEDLITYGLCLNIDKTKDGRIQDGFDYLGYRISEKMTSVRGDNILRIEQSIEKLFSTINDDNLRLSEWKINIRITGSIMKEHRYGWLFFFNRINDYQLLFHLDSVVDKLAKRYGVRDKIYLKRFVKAYHEIKNAIHTTKYIPNFDNWTLEKKRELITNNYKIDLSEAEPYEIERLFESLIYKELKDIERDIKNFS